MSEFLTIVKLSHPPPHSGTKIVIFLFLFSGCGNHNSQTITDRPLLDAPFFRKKKLCYYYVCRKGLNVEEGGSAKDTSIVFLLFVVRKSG